MLRWKSAGQCLESVVALKDCQSIEQINFGAAMQPKNYVIDLKMNVGI